MAGVCALSLRGACYNRVMKIEFIVFRPRRRKSEIKQRAGSNVSRYLNRLIEQDLAPRSVDWAEHFERKARSRRKFAFSHLNRDGER